jgi:predicted aspartyl protease
LVVRVRIRVSHGGRSVTAVVLVNSGAESDEPTVVLRPEVAEELGLPLDSFDIVEVELASGRTHSLISKERVRVELLDEEGRVLSSTSAYLVVDEDLTEPLITDATIDELGIVVLSFKRGLWRHVSDPPGVVRRSATPT